MNKHSLRHLKKEATIHALADAAFSLALEKGLDGIVVDDIVQQAGYSRRTFANYFSCKEEAVAAGAFIFDGAEVVIKWLEELDKDMSLVDSLYQLMKLQLTAEHFSKLRKLVSLSNKYPTLEPFVLSAFYDLQKTAQQMLMELSRGRYPEVYTHMLTGAVYGAVMPLLDGSLNVLFSDDSPTTEAADAVTFDYYLDNMFNMLRNGF